MSLKGAVILDIFLEELNKIKLNKQNQNSLWNSLSLIRNLDIDTEVYLDCYNELVVELGLKADAFIETNSKDGLTGNYYFDVFKKYFFKNKSYCQFRMIEIILNNLLKYSVYGINDLIDSIFRDTSLIPDNIDFYSIFCGYSYLPYLETMDDCIKGINNIILSINKILENNGVDFVLENRLGIKEIPDKVIEFNKKYGSLKEDEKLVSFIRKTDRYSFGEIVSPIISLTKNMAFTTANDEFLHGLDLYKEGNYKDCVTAMTSSLESTIKIICDKKGYTKKKNKPITGREQLVELVDILFLNGFFDFFTEFQKESMKTIFESGVGFLRNSATAHGNGLVPKKILEHTAKYTINLTSTLILYLINIYEDTK